MTIFVVTLLAITPLRAQDSGAYPGSDGGLEHSGTKHSVTSIPGFFSTGNDALDRALSLGEHGIDAFNQGNYVAAEVDFRAQRAACDALKSNDRRCTIRVLQELAATLDWEGRADEAEALYREVYARLVRADGAEARSTLDTLTSLGQFFYSQRRWSEAEVAFRQVLDSQSRTHEGDDYPIRFHLAFTLAQERHYAQAQALLNGMLYVGHDCEEPCSNPEPEYSGNINHRALIGFLRVQLGRYAEGYVDLKAAGDDIWQRARDWRTAPSSEASRAELLSGQSVFVSQMEAAWQWSHAP